MADENEFAEHLRTALHDGVDTLEPPPTLVPALRRRFARRVAAKRAGLVAAPLAVAAIVATAVLAPGGTPSAPAAPPSQRIQDVAYVTGQVTRALDDASRDVVHSTQTVENNGRTVFYEYWTTGDSSTVRKKDTIDGVVDADTFQSKDRSVAVLYDSRTWYQGAGWGSYTGGKVIIASPFPTPTGIKAQLAKGYLEIVGTGEQVGGQPTIHLRKTANAPRPTKGGPIEEYSAEFTELWVSEANYLPLRVRDQNPVNDQTDEYTWLPPTPENLALLEPPIPTGFKEVPEPTR